MISAMRAAALGRPIFTHVTAGAQPDRHSLCLACIAGGPHPSCCRIIASASAERCENSLVAAILFRKFFDRDFFLSVGKQPSAIGHDELVWRGEGRICATRGWISVDRGSKATLPLTMPRRVFKSSAKDSARRPSGISLQGGRVAVPPRWPYLRHVPVGVFEHPYRGSGGSRRAQAPLF